MDGRTSKRDPNSTFSRRRQHSPLDFSSTFYADRFELRLGKEWQSDTVYVLEGPTVDGFQHTLQVSVDPNAGDIAVVDYADLQIDLQIDGLSEGELLEKWITKLDNEMPAYRALFTWTAAEARRLYQDQLYFVHKHVGYKLSFSSTPKSRDLLGPQMERVMQTIEPRPPLRNR